MPPGACRRPSGAVRKRPRRPATQRLPKSACRSPQCQTRLIVKAAHRPKSACCRPRANRSRPPVRRWHQSQCAISRTPRASLACQDHAGAQPQSSIPARRLCSGVVAFLLLFRLKGGVPFAEKARRGPGLLATGFPTLGRLGLFVAFLKSSYESHFATSPSNRPGCASAAGAAMEMLSCSCETSFVRLLSTATPEIRTKEKPRALPKSTRSSFR